MSCLCRSVNVVFFLSGNQRRASCRRNRRKPACSRIGPTSSSNLESSYVNNRVYYCGEWEILLGVEPIFAGCDRRESPRSRNTWRNLHANCIEKKVKLLRNDLQRQWRHSAGNRTFEPMKVRVYDSSETNRNARLSKLEGNDEEEEEEKRKANGCRRRKVNIGDTTIIWREIFTNCVHWRKKTSVR